jgi:hypothetical protein
MLPSFRLVFRIRVELFVAAASAAHAIVLRTILNRFCRDRGRTPSSLSSRLPLPLCVFSHTLAWLPSSASVAHRTSSLRRFVASSLRRFDTLVTFRVFSRATRRLCIEWVLKSNSHLENALPVPSETTEPSQKKRREVKTIQPNVSPFRTINQPLHATGPIESLIGKGRKSAQPPTTRCRRARPLRSSS